ncbi:GNAT family N-acetyltransferase [Nocardia sp. IFM 10818]
MTVEVFDPNRDGEPVWWEEFRRANGLRATWAWDVLAAAGPRLGLAVVRDGGTPVAMAAARWTYGVANVAAPGSTGQPGWWVADPERHTEMLRLLAGGLRSRFRHAVLGTLWRELDREQAAALGHVRILREVNPLAVLPIEWPDEDGWLGTLSSNRRRSLRKGARLLSAATDLVAGDGSASELDTEQLIGLFRRTEIKYQGVRQPPRMSDRWLRTLLAHPEVRSVSYRDAAGNLLAAFTILDHPSWPLVHRWGALPADAGGHRHLYFDGVRRTVAWAAVSGKQGLIWGKGLDEVKQRLGCRLLPRYAVALPGR